MKTALSATAFPDVNDLVYFARVIEAGGFAAASRILGIPKSRLSRRVAELEAALDVRLLQRTTRKLSLTEIGARYLEHCKAVDAAALLAYDIVTNARSNPSGLLRVSAPVALADRQLAVVMPKFLKQNPEVRVELIVTNARVDLVAEGIDVALRVRFANEQDPQLVTRRLYENETWLVAAPALARRAGKLATPRALEALPTIGFVQADHSVEWSFIHAQHGELNVRTIPVYAADSIVAQHSATLAGIGCACLPALFVEAEVKRGALKRLLPDWKLPVNIAHAVYPTRKGLSPAVRAFVDFIAHALPVSAH
jgi:DNA-binding transcriptional LysR family regulator